MIGAIIGDTVGSIYEWDNHRDVHFPFWGKGCFFTDDSVMTLAVADWLLHGARNDIAVFLQRYGHNYPDRGYGGRFGFWLEEASPKPYNSWGNGSAMRVSACGFAARDAQEARDLARRSAEVTHNHPEGIKGAEAVAEAIFLARTGSDKEAIRQAVAKRYGYDLSRRCDDIRPSYAFDESCQGTVPEAFAAFFEASDFESAIRLAISLGGDSDTLACITGGIAESFYGVPAAIRTRALTYLDDKLRQVVAAFEAKWPAR